jgi:putative membrane protein
MRLLIRWVLSAATLMVVAHFVNGFYVRNFVAALIAAVVIGFVNATLGTLLRILTFPLTVLTLGLFLIVVNAVMLKVAAFFTPNFEVRTWTAALIGAILITIISTLLHWLLDDRQRERY